MPRVTWIRQRPADESSSGGRRHRTTIDLRAHGPALIAVAQSTHMSVAALVRAILANWLETHSAGDAGCDAAAIEVDAPDLPAKDGARIKVTLHMPAGHATELARAARAAELPRAFYVARLIDGMTPGPAAPDQREGRRALVRSAATLAAMSGDLHALMRVLRQASAPAQAACNATVAQLSDAVTEHLAAVALLIAALAPSRRSAASDPICGATRESI